MIGAGIGLAGAIAASRALASLLYGVGPVDPLTWVATPLFLLLVVLVSSWLPARQAARTDPATVLREDL
jgi:putative ABC transport system permease protein